MPAIMPHWADPPYCDVDAAEPSPVAKTDDIDDNTEASQTIRSARSYPSKGVLVGSFPSSRALDRYLRPAITFMIFASGLTQHGPV
jgi:hypothetical protein